MIYLIIKIEKSSILLLWTNLSANLRSPWGFLTRWSSSPSTSLQGSISLKLLMQTRWAWELQQTLQGATTYPEAMLCAFFILLQATDEIYIIHISSLILTNVYIIHVFLNAANFFSLTSSYIILQCILDCGHSKSLLDNILISRYLLYTVVLKPHSWA